MQWLILTLAGVTVGCGKTPERQSAGQPDTTAVSYVTSSEPEGALGVIDARKTHSDNVTVTGRIGGSAKPFVDGAAAFTIVDEALSPCSDDEGCPTPWDYCCSTGELPTSTALIKIVDEQGQLVTADAKELLNVSELATVVVHGKAERDAEGNLTVLAKEVFVKDAK
jgi:hypothetical protein